MPPEKVTHVHIAGHYVEHDGIIIDTHGADVIDPVWRLLQLTYETIGVKPTLLERDFNIPPTEMLLKELENIRHIQATCSTDDTSDKRTSLTNSGRNDDQSQFVST
jgi:uncharacterized protein (UPF0276 family)